MGYLLNCYRRRDFWCLVGQEWTGCDRISKYAKRLSLRLHRKRSQFPILEAMTAEEKDRYRALPRRVKVWRGCYGIIKEDRLGLDAIYIQAKRWQGSVGRPEIQKFVGALQGQRAKKGVFITTSAFTAEAIDYAARIDTKVILIDGQQLCNLMIDFDVSVSVAASYVVKRVDSDYFEEN